MCIGTSACKENVDFTINGLGIGHYFNSIIDDRSVNKGKPHPEIHQKCAYSIGLLNEQCLVFEDAQSGIQAAINAGMYCIAVENKGNLIGAHKKVNSLNEISDISVLINDLYDMKPKT